MYPIQCRAGFPMPLMAGKFEIVGFCATVETVTSDSQIAIFDDKNIGADDNFGNLIPIADIYNTKTLLVDAKGIANAVSNFSVDFGEPLKTRHGISIAADNIKGGSICLYRR